MDEKILYKIYFDYYDIGKSQNFKLNTDVEYIQFLANYKKIKGRTLNAHLKNLKSYFLKNKDTIELFDNGNKFEINLKNKDIVYVCISLNNIEFVQTSIQKLDGKVLKKVNKYPIIINYLDLSSILELTSLNSDPILKYFSERYFTINELKMLSLDIDEIDVLGFLTDEQNERVYKMIKDNFSSVDTNIMITNGTYRNQVNNFLNEKFFYNLYKK